MGHSFLFLFMPCFVLPCFLLKTRHFEYFNTVTLEMRILSPSPVIFVVDCWGLESSFYFLKWLFHTIFTETLLLFLCDRSLLTSIPGPGFPTALWGKGWGTVYTFHIIYSEGQFRVLQRTSCTVETPQWSTRCTQPTWTWNNVFKILAAN